MFYSNAGVQHDLFHRVGLRSTCTARQQVQFLQEVQEIRNAQYSEYRTTLYHGTPERMLLYSTMAVTNTCTPARVCIHKAPRSASVYAVYWYTTCIVLVLRALEKAVDLATIHRPNAIMISGSILLNKRRGDREGPVIP